MIKEFKDLLGKVIVELIVKDYEIYLRTLDGYTVRFYHRQDCCESVWIEDITGDTDDLLHARVLQAEEVTEQGENNDEYSSSSTWTFYKFQTSKGHVTIRWCGQSNGYYSERVDMEIIRPHYPSDLIRF